MLTLNYDDLRAIRDIIRQEESDLMEEESWAYDEMNIALYDLGGANSMEVADLDHMDDLRQAYYAAYANTIRLIEQAQALHKVRDAMERAARMLTDYVTDYEKDGE